MAEPFILRRLADGAEMEYDAPVPIPAGFERVGGTAPAESGRFLAGVAQDAKAAAGDTVDFVTRTARLITGQQRPETAQDIALLTLGLSGPIGWAGKVGASVGVPAAIGRGAVSAGITTGHQAVRGDELTPGTNVVAAGAGEGLGALVGKLAKVGAGASDAIKGIRTILAAKDKTTGGIDARAFDQYMNWWRTADTPAMRDFRRSRLESFLQGVDPQWGADLAKTFGKHIAEFGVRIPFGTYLRPTAGATVGAMAPTIPISPEVSAGFGAAGRAIASPAGRATFDTLAQEAAEHVR